MLGGGCWVAVWWRSFNVQACRARTTCFAHFDSWMLFWLRMSYNGGVCPFDRRECAVFVQLLLAGYSHRT